MSRPENDDLLRALRGLPEAEPDANRSRAIVADALSVMARRRRLTERRVVMLAAVYAAMLAPVATGSLAAAYLAAAIVQAVVVFRFAHAGVF